MGGSPRRRLILVVCLSTIGVLALFFGFRLRYRQLDQALQIIAHVKLRYVEPVSTTALIHSYLKTGTLEGMLATLRDPYTRYLDPAEYRELKLQTDGTFGGIGVILNHDGDRLVIMKVLEGTPGMKAGLRRGDVIMRINGRSTGKMSSEEAAGAIRGPEGTRVTLTIARGSGKGRRVFPVTIIRARIRLPSVEWEFIEVPRAGRIAFITLSQFAERTPAEIEEALRAVERAGARGLILDLRYNPGGLLEAAIGVASKFLQGGVVMYMVGRNHLRKPFYVQPHPPRTYPLVILVNQWSASASEILAGALKDRGAATLVGTKTFGKGVVQEIVPLTGGGALSVTVAKYLTAGGRSIDKIGVTPHVVVDRPGVMERALKTGNPEELQELDDLQRERAVEILCNKLASSAAAAL